jgi:ribulose-phosphate 3-epimerase
MANTKIELVPAILRKTFEGIEEDWNKVQKLSDHIQLDITDGVFAGEGTYRDIQRFKQLPESQKIELHMMVHTPANFVNDIIDLNPARCIFHLESFEGTNDIDFVYAKLRDSTQSQLALAINPESPNERLEEHLSLIDYALFMGYNPGWANQPINPIVFNKIRQCKDKHPRMLIAVDGHVAKDTIGDYVRAGAQILCANTAIFAQGNPAENYRQLQLIATAAMA